MTPADTPGSGKGESLGARVARIFCCEMPQEQNSQEHLAALVDRLSRVPPEEARAAAEEIVSEAQMPEGGFIDERAAYHEEAVGRVLKILTRLEPTPPPCPECERLKSEVRCFRGELRRMTDRATGFEKVWDEDTKRLTKERDSALAERDAALNDAQWNRDQLRAALAASKAADALLIEARSAVEDDARTCELAIPELAARRRATLARIDAHLSRREGP